MYIILILLYFVEDMVLQFFQMLYSNSKAVSTYYTSLVNCNIGNCNVRCTIIRSCCATLHLHVDIVFRIHLQLTMEEARVLP